MRRAIGRVLVRAIDHLILRVTDAAASGRGEPSAAERPAAEPEKPIRPKWSVHLDLRGAFLEDGLMRVPIRGTFTCLKFTAESWALLQTASEAAGGAGREPSDRDPLDWWVEGFLAGRQEQYLRSLVRRDRARTAASPDCSGDAA